MVHFRGLAFEACELLRESHLLIFRCIVPLNAFEQLVGLDLDQDNVGFLDTMLSLQDEPSLSPRNFHDTAAMPPPDSSHLGHIASTHADDSERVERQNGTSSSSSSHIDTTPISHHGLNAAPGGEQRQPQKKKQAPPGAWATPPNPSYHSANQLKSGHGSSGGGDDSTVDRAEFLRKTTSMPDFSGFGLLPGGGPGAAAFAGFASGPGAHGGKGHRGGVAGGNTGGLSGRNMSHGDLTAAIWGTPLPGAVVPGAADKAGSNRDGPSFSGIASLGGEAEERASSHHGRQTSSASMLPSSDGYSDGGSGEDGRAPRKQRPTREPRSVSSSNSWPDLNRINMAASPHLPEHLPEHAPPPRSAPHPAPATAGTYSSSGPVAVESATVEPPLMPQPSGGLRLAGGGSQSSSFAAAAAPINSSSLGPMTVPQLGRFVLSTPSSASALASSTSGAPFLAPSTNTSSSRSANNLAAASALGVPSWPMAVTKQDPTTQPGPTGSLRRGAKSSGSMTGGRNNSSTSHGCEAGSSSSSFDPAAQRAAAEEERRNRRLARNRASARLRRQRKKGLVESSEADVALLEHTLQRLQRHRWGTSGLHARSPLAPPSSSHGGGGVIAGQTTTTTPMGPPPHYDSGGGSVGSGNAFLNSPFVDLGAALEELRLSGAAADRADADHSPGSAAAAGMESDRVGSDVRAIIGGGGGGGGGGSGSTKSSSARSSDPLLGGHRSRGAAGAALRARQEAVHCTRGHLIEAMALPELLKAASAAAPIISADGASGSASAASESHAHAQTNPSSSISSRSGDRVESSSSSSSSSRNASSARSGSSDALAGMGEELTGLLHLSAEQRDQLLDLSTASTARTTRAGADSTANSALAHASSSSRSRRETDTGGVVATVADDVLELAVLNKCLEALRGPRWQETPTLESLQTAWQELLTAPQQRAFASWLRSNQVQVASLDLSVRGAHHAAAHHRAPAAAAAPALPRFVFEQRSGSGGGGGTGGYDDEDLDRDSDSLSHQHSSSNSLSAGHYHSSSNSLPGAGHGPP